MGLTQTGRKSSCPCFDSWISPRARPRTARCKVFHRVVRASPSSFSYWRAFPCSSHGTSPIVRRGPRFFFSYIKPHARGPVRRSPPLKARGNSMTVAFLRHTEKRRRSKRVQSPAARTRCLLFLKGRAGPATSCGPALPSRGGKPLPLSRHPSTPLNCPSALPASWPGSCCP